MDDAIRELATELGDHASSPGDATYLRRGIVTAASRALNTYTVTVGGGSVADIPGYRNVAANVGDWVDLLFDGPASRVVGVVGQNVVWQTPTLQNGWANYGGGYWTVGYGRDHDGFVHLRGMIAGGTMPGTVFTLPADFRPAAHMFLPIVAGGVFNFLQITSAGAVTIQLTAGGNTWVSLDGLQFPTV